MDVLQPQDEPAAFSRNPFILNAQIYSNMLNFLADYQLHQTCPGDI